MGAALWWGTVAASSLLIGALLGVFREWSARVIGLVLGFGAGALIASIAYDLSREGYQTAGPWPVVAGTALGAVTFFMANRVVLRWGAARAAGTAGLPLALGALLDGIPEQAVLGLGLAQGGGVGVALLVAIFVSNLPEGVGSASAMVKGGTPRRQVLLLWTGVTVVCLLSTVGGYALDAFTADRFVGVVDGFAAGALLVMLVTSMIPEANERAGDLAGLATVLGFAVAAGLSVQG